MAQTVLLVYFIQSMGTAGSTVTASDDRGVSSVCERHRPDICNVSIYYTEGPRPLGLSLAFTVAGSVIFVYDRLYCMCTALELAVPVALLHEPH